MLNDFDRVDETNLPRQILYGPEDVGALKVEAAQKRLTMLNPEVEVVFASHHWPTWGGEEIAAFLDRWRFSRFGIQRAGYQALIQLLQAAWYGNPISWSTIGVTISPEIVYEMPVISRLSAHLAGVQPGAGAAASLGGVATGGVTGAGVPPMLRTTNQPPSASTRATCSSSRPSSSGCKRSAMGMA